MAIYFCEKCKKILNIKKEDDKNILSCSCDFKKYDELSIGEKNKDKKGEGIFEKKITEEGFPHLCEKCFHTESEVIDLGAPYSDESNIYLFKCKKCGYVKRQAD